MGVRPTRFARVTSRCKGDAILFSYVLYFPSAPSGTLTMLRLSSPYALGVFYLLLFKCLVRVTGGVCAL